MAHLLLRNYLASGFFRLRIVQARQSEVVDQQIGPAQHLCAQQSWPILDELSPDHCRVECVQGLGESLSADIFPQLHQQAYPHFPDTHMLGMHVHLRGGTLEFWRRVERALPDFERRKIWLAENGISVDGL